VIFTPGHSNGHVCYYFPDEKFLLSGDTVLPQITPNLSPDLFDENFRPLNCFLESLKVLENLPVEKVYPGHGNTFSGVKTRANEMRGHHAERSQLILNFLSTIPKTTRQVSEGIFGSNLPDFDKFLALNETYVHLLELKLKGKIKEEINGDNLVYCVS
jgi:glyoxylase-like metal-dependent hydrolase (beta-lactamase superfamily II)